uniref:Nup188 domain-containing protein n=1 Tax=Macrostomum lignano TaxID=282301 RepID=A0A1I8I3U3_9PLAT
MYHLLTFIQQNGNHLDEETFCHEVVDVKDILKEGPVYYKPAKLQDQEIEADVKMLNLQSEVQSFMCKLSAYLNLDAQVAHSVFLEFLASNPDLDSDNLKLELSASSSICSLLPQIRQYYFTERISMLRLYKVAFADSSSSQPWSTLAELLQTVLMDLAGREYKHVLEMLMKFYKSLPESGQRLSSKYFPFIDDEEDARQWRDQRLQEAEETLQAIFLLVNSVAYADKLSSNLDSLNGMVECFINQQLTVPIGLAPDDFDSNSAENQQQQQQQQDVRYRRVAFLQCLIVLAALDPAEACRQLSCSEEGGGGGSLDLPVFDRVSELLRSQLPGNRGSQAPVLLMCAVVLGSRGGDSAEGAAAVQLADKAIRRLNVFDYLAGCLGPDVQVNMGVGVGIDPSSDFSCSSALLQLYNCLVMDLLALVSAYAALDSLGEQHKSAYLSLFASLLPSVCASGQRHQQEDQHPRRRFSIRSLCPVLERMCTEFPASVAIFHVCSQLAGMAGSTAADAADDGSIGDADEADDLVCDLVTSLGAFSERISDLGDNPADYLMLDNAGDQQQVGGGVVATVERRPIGVGGPVIPAGCKGEIIGDEYITWQLPETYSVWPVIEQELAIRCRQALHQMPEAEANRLAGILADARTWLVKQKFQGEALRLADHAMCLLVRQPSGMQRYPALLAGCISFLAACLPLDGQRLARQLERCGALPLIRSPFEFDKPNSYQLESSLICTVHDNQECAIGQYPVLSAYLDFLVALAVCQLPDLCDLLLSGIVYVSRVLLPNFQRWRYQDPMDSVRIASKCLLFLHEVLNTTYSSLPPASGGDASPPAYLQSLCLRMLRSSLLAPLIAQLATIPVAKLILESDMSTYGLTTDSLPLARTVWLALSLLNRLVPTADSQQQPQPDLLAKLGLDPDRITQSLLTYTWYYSTPRVTKMALIVLKKLVKFSRTSNLALADGCSKRLTRTLLDRLASATESEEVRALLFDFLSESVLCGKTSLLNDLVSVQRDSSATAAAAAKPGADCCLTIALNLLASADTISPLLLSSVVQLFSSLWLQNCTILTGRVRSSSTFWSSLQSVLSADPVQDPAEDPLCCQAVTWAHALGLLGIELLMYPNASAATASTADEASLEDDSNEAGVSGLATRQRCLHQLACGIRTLLTVSSSMLADNGRPRPDWRQLRARLSRVLSVRCLPAVTRSCLASALLAAVNSDDNAATTDSVDRLTEEIQACSAALSLSLSNQPVNKQPIVADLLAVLTRSVESVIALSGDESSVGGVDTDKLASLACRSLDGQPQLSLALLAALLSLASVQSAPPVSVVDILPLLTNFEDLPQSLASMPDSETAELRV